MNQGNPERFGNPVPRDTTSAERTTCEHCGKQVIPLIPHPCVGPASPVRDPAPPDANELLEAARAVVEADEDWDLNHNHLTLEWDDVIDRLKRAVRGVRDPQPELGNDIRRLKIALAAAISALKAGEPWHYSGCAGCAEIEAAMIGGPPPKETPQ